MLIEEWVKPIQQLANGKQINLPELLELTQKEYRASRQLYNLSTRRKTGGPRLVPINKMARKPCKYSLEDLRWILDNKPAQIAERYRVTVKQAYAIRHYAKQQFFG